ncbi:MAG: ribokinase [Acidimicrobiales bacterium]|jgi:ribokinase
MSIPSVDVVVVGSINLDISVPVPHLPEPGETVLGGDALWSPGGKGANQAVALARLGRQVAMIGCVGNDPAGEQQRSHLASQGVDCTGIVALPDVPTGLATISVADSSGENSIVVSPGANARVDAELVRDLLVPARALLVQFEVPADAVAAAIEGYHGLVVVNPAPARLLDDAVLGAVDVLVPNRGELALLAGASAEAVTTDELADQARSLGVGAVVITLGGEGALIVATEVTAVPIVPVAAIDTTAAGDSFCGGLVDALLDGVDLVAAAVWASRVAAVTVTRRGAQASLPSRAEVEALS